jgi:hypothetical protein
VIRGLLHFRRPLVQACALLAMFAITIGLAGCSSTIMKHEHSQEILKNDEFDKAFKVQEVPEHVESGEYVRLPGPVPVPGAFKKTKHQKISKPVRSRPGKKTVVADVAPTPEPTPTARQPEFEDSEGFEGRRPKVDPFRVGEKVTMTVSYFALTAGEFTIEVRPFVQVDGHKSYHFAGTAITTSVFASFYAVDDWFETFVDYETLLPYSYALHVKETKQLREARSLFDWKKMKAFFWDKKINSEGKVEEKKLDWDLAPYSQNIFTAAYYLRNAQLAVGKKLAFNLSHENENLRVTAEVLRKEHIETPAGEFDTVVVKPKIEINGAFKPVGDIFVWMTDDDRKLIVRIESKIKIGKIVGVAKSIELGTK